MKHQLPLANFELIANSIPHILDYLQLNSIDDIKLIDYGVDYRTPIRFDKVVKGRIGFDDVPYINAFSQERDYRTVKNKSTRDSGILLCETKITNHIFDIDSYELTEKTQTDTIRFVNIFIELLRSEDTIHQQYIAVAKGKAYKLLRHFQKQHSLYITQTRKPVLPEEQLELVLNNSIKFLKKKADLKRLGLKVKRGILLMGKPGNGKTMLCNYLKGLCRESKIDYHIINNSELRRYLSNGTLERELAEHRVTFFDDIEISFLNRAHGKDLACTLLSAMDGMHDESASIKIFTTNESLGEMDEAFYRPGRIDLMIEIVAPTRELRERYIKEFWPEQMINIIKDQDSILNHTDGFSYADLSQIASICGANYLFKGKWDIEAALEEHDRSRILNIEHEKSFGFNFKPKKKKERQHNEQT